MKAIHYYFVFLFGVIYINAKACQCPLTVLGLEESEKYSIIFRGKIVSVKQCDEKPGSAIFELEELFKGNVTKQFEILFDCKEECAQSFNAGDEWIIYTNYKQVNNAKMDWCSRSRKYFKNEKEDFYTVTYGNDYLDELRFLRKYLGIHRFLADNNVQVENRNVIPDKNQVVYMVLISIVVIVLFYWLFNRFFK